MCILHILYLYVVPTCILWTLRVKRRLHSKSKQNWFNFMHTGLTQAFEDIFVYILITFLTKLYNLYNFRVATRVEAAAPDHDRSSGIKDLTNHGHRPASQPGLAKQQHLGNECNTSIKFCCSSQETGKTSWRPTRFVDVMLFIWNTCKKSGYITV